MPDRRILLVEDDPGIRQGLADLLALEGYPVDVAGSGDEALEFLRRRRAALILMDLVRPAIAKSKALLPSPAA